MIYCIFTPHIIMIIITCNYMTCEKEQEIAGKQCSFWLNALQPKADFHTKGGAVNSQIGNSLA